MSPQTRNWLLAAVVILLVLVPLAYRGWIAEGTEWGGADMQGVAAVEQLAGANFQAWFEPIYSPGDLERYFFGLQALLGTLLVAGFVGWLLGRSRARNGISSGTDLAIAAALSAIGVVMAIALFFVETEFGELQATISASQGIGLGLLAFFVGYPLGRRAGAGASG
jgi:cobalt/nickel transport protein